MTRPFLERMRSALLLISSCGAFAGCSLLFDPGPIRQARSIDGGSLDDAPELPSDARPDVTDVPCATGCSCVRDCPVAAPGYCEPLPDRRQRFTSPAVQQLFGGGEVTVAVSGLPRDETFIAVPSAPETLGFLEGTSDLSALLYRSPEGVGRAPISGRGANATFGMPADFDARLGAVDWFVARGPRALLFRASAPFGTSLCTLEPSSALGCVMTPRTAATAGGLGGDVVFLAERVGASQWSFVSPTTGTFTLPDDVRFAATGGPVVLAQSRTDPTLATLFRQAPSAGIERVEVGLCARVAAEPDGSVHIAHLDACGAGASPMRVSVFSTRCAAGAPCDCGASCDGAGDAELLLDYTNLELPSTDLIDWAFEVDGSLRALALLVGDSSETSVGTDVLVAVWNAEDGATEPRRFEPIHVSSGRLTELGIRGIGDTVALNLRGEDARVDVQVLAWIRGLGEVPPAVALGGVSFCR